MCDLNTDAGLYVFDANEDLKSDCVEAGVIFGKESSLSERYSFLVGTPGDRAEGSEEAGFGVRWTRGRCCAV